MKIVQMPGSTYAIRRLTLFGYSYYDQRAHKHGARFWWHRGSSNFPDCLSDNLLATMALAADLQWWHNPRERWRARYGAPITGAQKGSAP